jgi:O-antigen ligase
VLIAFGVVIALGAGAVAAHAGAREPRSSYWHVAWHEYLAHPVLGSGAGTFAYYWERSGRVLRFGGALDAHSLYLETLAELGTIGLLLLALMLLVPLYAGVANRRAPYVPVATGAYLAFLVHAGLDWDWEMPAVIVAGLSLGAACLVPEYSPPRPHPRARALLLVAAFLLGACAIAGARGHTRPAASPRTEKAPVRGPSRTNPPSAAGYLSWPLFS